MAKYQKYTCIDTTEYLVDYLYTPNPQKIGGTVWLQDRRRRMTMREFEIVDKRTTDKGDHILTVTESED